jgi:hypothetical protein
MLKDRHEEGNAQNCSIQQRPHRKNKEDKYLSSKSKNQFKITGHNKIHQSFKKQISRVTAEICITIKS